jgi:hypothetical protein
VDGLITIIGTAAGLASAILTVILVIYARRAYAETRPENTPSGRGPDSRMVRSLGVIKEWQPLLAATIAAVITGPTTAAIVFLFMGQPPRGPSHTPIIVRTPSAGPVSVTSYPITVTSPQASQSVPICSQVQALGEVPPDKTPWIVAIDPAGAYWIEGVASRRQDGTWVGTVALGHDDSRGIYSVFMAEMPNGGWNDFLQTATRANGGFLGAGQKLPPSMEQVSQAVSVNRGTDTTPTSCPPLGR